MSTSPLSNDDSAIIQPNPDQPDILEVFETGKRIIVGFGKQEAPDDLCIATYRDQIRQLIKDHNCTEFGFDLQAFTRIASGTLGLIASVRKQDVKVYVFNVSPKVREVFKLTKLDQHLEMYDPRNPPKEPLDSNQA